MGIQYERLAEAAGGEHAVMSQRATCPAAGHESLLRMQELVTPCKQVWVRRHPNLANRGPCLLGINIESKPRKIYLGTPPWLW